MYSVAKLFIPVLMAGALLGSALSSCSSEAKRQQQAARSLADEAEDLLRQNRFEEAFVIMDSVDHAFPQQIEVRRDVTKMRSQAMGDYAELQIYLCDSIIAALSGDVDKLSKSFTHVSGGDIPGYYVKSSQGRDAFLSSTGFEGRIDDESYRFYVVAVNNGAPIGIHQIAVVSNDGSATTQQIPDDSNRAGETGDGAIDLATFELGECQPLAEWLVGNAASVDHALLIGRLDGKKIPYTPAQAKALVETWQFAEKASQLYQARLQRAKAERQLIIARDHTVNL